MTWWRCLRWDARGVLLCYQVLRAETTAGGCPVWEGAASGELRELGQGESEDTAVLVLAPCLFSPSLQALHGGSMWWCL